MNVKYLVEITEAQTHMVKVTLTLKRDQAQKRMRFFMPSWSPGSYLMREYAKNIRTLRVLTGKGEYLQYRALEKNLWEIDWQESHVKDTENFSIEYEIYCHDLTVRTSHVDSTHAFLHGPSYLMGVMDQEIIPEIELRFPALWSKVHTGLEELYPGTKKFVFKAENYDVLIDAPIEIGCHESDGFMLEGREHYLVFYGKTFPHKLNLKNDIKTIVEHVAKTMGDIPYDKYVFITHFVPGLYGGLEHLNSTALQFDGRTLTNRDDYLNWLSLVAHEYFHTWNVKRIRPRELGPFNYLEENYTTMHWLTEGLTSFMDDWFVYRAGLSTLEEYLEIVKKHMNRYFSVPGRKFQSLEQSSFSAWIKLYRPDENSNNSSISYYLKGGLVFMVLHLLLKEKKAGVENLLEKLWKRYQDNPQVGVESAEVFQMIEEVGGPEIKDQFIQMVTTTEEIDFEKHLKSAGIEIVWNKSQAPYLGVTWKIVGRRLFIERIDLDSAAYKAGLNAGDEILAIGGQRVLATDKDNLNNWVNEDTTYEFTISRTRMLQNIEVQFGKAPKAVQELKIIDRNKTEGFFSPL